MVEINIIIIIKTPFHQKSIEHLFPHLFNSNQTLLLYSSILDVGMYKCQKQELTAYDFSRKSIFNNPVKFLKPFRQKIKKIKHEIKILKETYIISDKTEVYIGSDKDIFTQTLLYNIKTRLLKLIAVDEGLAYYVRLSKKDHLIAFLYQICTPLLFGQRLFFIKRMGALPIIDVVYLRNLELLPSKIKGISYKGFEMKSTQVKKPIEKGKILFFSFPDQDLQYSAEEKIVLHVSIATYLEGYGRSLIIKPHPREDIEFLRDRLKDKQNVYILDEKQLGENLQYFEYELIINMFSSVILDIIDSSYPKINILTLGYTNIPPIKFDENLRYIPLNKFNVTKHISLIEHT